MATRDNMKKGTKVELLNPEKYGFSGKTTGIIEMLVSGPQDKPMAWVEISGKGRSIKEFIEYLKEDEEAAVVAHWAEEGGLGPHRITAEQDRVEGAARMAARLWEDIPHSITAEPAAAAAAADASRKEEQRKERAISPPRKGDKARGGGKRRRRSKRRTKKRRTKKRRTSTRKSRRR